MTLRTKSILAEPSPEDGWRICVMRKIRPDYKFDMWWPVLAPSLELLKGYKDEDISWQEYIPIFQREVLEGKAEYVKELAEISAQRDVTILCYEKTSEKCHRRLLAQACKEYRSDLEVILD